MAHRQSANRRAGRPLALAAIVALVVTLAPGVGATGVARAAGPAPDGPGALSHFDLARKDCIGTARNRTSKVWFTVANGILSDVYYPTIDTTNVETLQFVVTDGSTFTDLQSRDTTSSVSALDRTGMSCRVTSTAKNGKYRLQTDYVTDPSRNTLLMHTMLTPLAGGPLKVYVRFDASVNGNGGGGGGNGGPDSATVDTSTGHPIAVSSDTSTVTQAANRDYAQPVYAALDGPFSAVESGFVGGASDGLVQLDASHALTQTYATAGSGNVVQTAAVTLSHASKPTFTLALGFGSTQSKAVKAAEGSIDKGFDAARKAYASGWTKYDADLNDPSKKLKSLFGSGAQRLIDQYYSAANVIKASEDKTFPGAIIAGLASPWGQAVSAGDPANTYFGSYREVFSRDLYEAWTGLIADGDLDTARDAVKFLFQRQQLPDGSMPRNSLVNGKLAPDSFGTQLDETAYPILMADAPGMSMSSPGCHCYATDIRPAANFLISHGPAFGAERWEEQGGYSPSTIAAEIAGLVAAADIAKKNGDATSANLYLGVADDYQRSIKGWTVTTDGPLSTDPYFIRLSKSGDPNSAESYNVGNGGPTLDQRAVIDAGFLELVRLGELPANDPAVASSIPVVDATIKSSTPSGDGWHRYNGDGYGDRASDGRPWAPSGQGSGHVWPALGAERGEYQLLVAGPSSGAAFIPPMANFASGLGLIPEQDWELADLAASAYGTDPTTASIGFRNGGPAGSAAPLTWSEGAFVRLVRDVTTGGLIDRPPANVKRYISHPLGATSLTLTAPADTSAISSSPVTVTGTTVAGNHVYAAATNTDSNSATTTASTTAAGDGSFSLDLVVTGGTSVINVVAVSPSGATAHAQRTVVWDFTPGTVLLDVTDPSNDDNGPGNYAYPTSDNFKPGAFDITDFKVILSPDGLTTTFKLQTRNLSPTFGSPLGAQLVDVYVHDPGAGTTSTAASFGQRNYAIDAGSAWSRLLEVQGFGQRYVDASNTGSVGTISISANAISRYITFSVPTASLGGTPGSGWGFTVVLTGQDGFSSDQARGFQATPQDFQFGVCASASADPHCTANPGAVPKAVDVITPSGVDQSTELDYTLGPVVIEDVVIP